MPLASESPVEIRTATQKRRALIVEPTAALARLLPGMFRQLGFDVDIVSAPEDAVVAAENGLGFDLLVTELALPEISGRTVAGFITSRHPETAVLYLCDGLARPSIEKHGVAALEKPFSLQHLSDAIHNLFAPNPG